MYTYLQNKLLASLISDRSQCSSNLTQLYTFACSCCEFALSSEGIFLAVSNVIWPSSYTVSRDQ